jgi:hypothetical protein
MKQISLEIINLIIQNKTILYRNETICFALKKIETFVLIYFF